MKTHVMHIRNTNSPKHQEVNVCPTANHLPRIFPKGSKQLLDSICAPFSEPQTSGAILQMYADTSDQVQEILQEL